MPSRTISILGFSSAALVVAYLAIMIVTVSLAAWQTDLAMEAHETEQEIGRLERAYYDRVAEIDAKHPSELGLGKPVRVTYAAKAQVPAVTLR